jgi:prophage antirepressor-like protein
MEMIKPFLFEEDHLVRVVEKNGDPWFVAKDVCLALTIAWCGKTLINIPEDWQGMWKFHTPSNPSGTGGGTQELVIINESALYKLAFRSRKPAADRFTNWVVHNVLPQIRKTGQYQTIPQPTQNFHFNIDREQHCLAMVRECRLTFGEYQAIKLWMRLPLPPVSEASLPSYIRVMLWRDRQSEAQDISRNNPKKSLYSSLKNNDLNNQNTEIDRNDIF